MRSSPIAAAFSGGVAGFMFAADWQHVQLKDDVFGFSNLNGESIVIIPFIHTNLKVWGFTASYKTPGSEGTVDQAFMFNCDNKGDELAGRMLTDFLAMCQSVIR